VQPQNISLIFHFTFVYLYLFHTAAFMHSYSPLICWKCVSRKCHQRPEISSKTITPLIPATTSRITSGTDSHHHNNWYRLTTAVQHRSNLAKASVNETLPENHHRRSHLGEGKSAPLVRCLLTLLQGLGGDELLYSFEWVSVCGARSEARSTGLLVLRRTTTRREAILPLDERTNKDEDTKRRNRLKERNRSKEEAMGGEARRRRRPPHQVQNPRSLENPRTTN
jgi:hypothetical protein